MKQLSPIEIQNLRIAHFLYSNLGKPLWIASSFFLLFGSLVFAGSLYASLANSDIEIAKNYGYAMSGPSTLRQTGASDPYGENIANGCLMAGVGVCGLVGGFVLRRKSRSFQALPDDLKKPPVQAAPRNLNEILWGRKPDDVLSNADELAKLHALMRSGAITEEEFKKAKERLLSA